MYLEKPRLAVSKGILRHRKYALEQSEQVENSEIEGFESMNL